MACSVSHIYNEIKDMVKKQIEEDKGRQLAIMNLAVEYDNACTAKDVLWKAYEECNDIPQEQRALIVDDVISDEILDDLLKGEFNIQLHLKGDDKANGPLKDMVKKQIEEDKGRQLAIMNLAVEYDNACTAKDVLWKAYEECNDIPQEQRALIVTFLKEESNKDYEMHNALDEWKWSMDISGSFKVCTLSRRIQNLLLADHRVGNHRLWNLWIPRKVNICVWRASLNRLPTRANLASRGVDLDSANCPFCNNITEDLDHCVTKCPIILPIWRKVWSWWDMVPPVVFPSFTISDIARGIIDPFTNSRIGKIWHGVFQTALWAIWKWRNRIVNAPADTTPNIKEEDISRQFTDFLGLGLRPVVRLIRLTRTFGYLDRMICFLNSSV
ncbi:RNA-directed DNA polymerase, eukaryota, reverse transcriptase zinc-binding domain protein [Tanacetum coccineum]